MICQYGKRFAVGLLLLLLLSSPTFSDGVYLTEAEMVELEAIFVRLGTRLDVQKTQIEQLEAQLTTASQQLEISTSAIENLKTTLNEVEKSYAEQERECRIRILRTAGITALISAAVGLIAGLLL